MPPQRRHSGCPVPRTDPYPPLPRNSRNDFPSGRSVSVPSHHRIVFPAIIRTSSAIRALENSFSRDESSFSSAAWLAMFRAVSQSDNGRRAKNAAAVFTSPVAISAEYCAAAFPSVYGNLVPKYLRSSTVCRRRPLDSGGQRFVTAPQPILLTPQYIFGNSARVLRDEYFHRFVCVAAKLKRIVSDGMLIRAMKEAVPSNVTGRKYPV